MLVLVLFPCLVLAQDAVVDPYIDELAGPLGLGDRDIRDTVASIINVALGLLGIIAVVIVIYAGFLWMTAGGSQDKIDDAKKWLSGGIIGMVIVLSAYAIASFIISSLMTATT